MSYKWVDIAKAEFLVLTARFRGHRFVSFGLLFIIGIVWAAYLVPLLVELVVNALSPIIPVQGLLMLMFPELMRAVMMLIWTFLLFASLSQALQEIKIGQWEIFLANNVRTRDILIGTFLGRVPIFGLNALFFAPPLLAPFLLIYQVSLPGQLMIYGVLVLNMLITVWLSNFLSAAIQTKLGSSPRGNSIAKAIAILLGFILFIPIICLQLFAQQFAAVMGLNLFLVFPFTWSADLISWLAIIFNGINLTAHQIGVFQSILQFDLLTNTLFIVVFGCACVGIALATTDRVFTYSLGPRMETITTITQESSLYRFIRRITPNSFGALVVTSFKDFFRKPQNLSRVALGLLLTLLLPVIVILAYGQRYTIELSSVIPITGFGLAFTGVLVFSGVAFLESRDQLWIIQSAPYGASRFVKARLATALLIAVPLSIIPTASLTFIANLSLMHFFGLLAYGYLLICSAVILGTGITALGPNYEDMKSPGYTRNLMISMMLCLVSTMMVPLVLSMVIRRILGVSLTTLMLGIGIPEEISTAIMPASILLVLGVILLLVGTWKLGRPDT